MEIRIRQTGAVIAEREFRDMHTNTSFPAVLTLDILNDFGADPVMEAPAPVYDMDTQSVYRDGVTQDALGNWVYAWGVRELTAEEIEARKPTVAQYISALEEMYDTEAQSHKYDNRFTCALRAGYPGPFQAEGTAFAIWMDTCNATAYSIMDSVMQGEIAQPSVPDLLALMPPMVWPAS